MLLDSDGKAAVIAAAGETFDTFVETGTAVGDLPLRLVDRFDTIVTIEADARLHRSAMSRLSGHRHVRCVRGDSARKLGPLLDELDRPCIIWLDAHEIADDGPAAMTDEVDAITTSVRAGHRHAVLVDDARLCDGRKGWLHIDDLESWATIHDYSFDVVDDIVRLLPLG